MLTRLANIGKRLVSGGADGAWASLQGELATMDAAGLQRSRRDLAAQARELDGLRASVDQRLGTARASVPLPKVPRNADWSGRAGPWQGPVRPAGQARAVSHSPLGDSVTLFHDCPMSEVTWRQSSRFDHPEDAPFAVAMDVMAFEGTFLSLALALPGAAVTGLRQSHIFQLDLKADLERQVPIYARLNIQHGPNHEDQVREVPFDPRGTYVEFDLAYLQMNEKRVESVWIDLIFDTPAYNRFLIRDLYLHRRPRAEI